MKKSAKVVFALIVSVAVTGYAVSCSSKTETATNSADTTKIDSTTVVKADADTTQSIDSVTSK